jgi:hypothetical protein
MEYNLRAIRQLIIEAFDDEELITFCHDYFGEVIQRFSSGMSKSAKVLQLVTYCERRERLGSLLEKVRAERPEKYEKYQARLVTGRGAGGGHPGHQQGVVHSDAYSSYEVGLRQLLRRLGQDHSLHVEALVYQQRLLENIAQSRLHGDTDTRKAERSAIIGRLNDLALSALGVSFSELCGLV